MTRDELSSFIDEFILHHQFNLSLEKINYFSILYTIHCFLNYSTHFFITLLNNTLRNLLIFSWLPFVHFHHFKFINTHIDRLRIQIIYSPSNYFNGRPHILKGGTIFISKLLDISMYFNPILCHKHQFNSISNFPQNSS